MTQNLHEGFCKNRFTVLWCLTFCNKKAPPAQNLVPSSCFWQVAPVTIKCNLIMMMSLLRHSRQDTSHPSMGRTWGEHAENSFWVLRWVYSRYSSFPPPASQKCWVPPGVAADKEFPHRDNKGIMKKKSHANERGAHNIPCKPVQLPCSGGELMHFSEPLGCAQWSSHHRVLYTLVKLCLMLIMWNGCPSMSKAENDIVNAPYWKNLVGCATSEMESVRERLNFMKKHTYESLKCTRT